MFARLHTAVPVGLTAYSVNVEVDVSRGLPAITVIGLGDNAVLHARDRIRAAFGNSGFDWPDRRIVVSLSPSDLPMHGAGYDLPIAIGLLVAAGYSTASAVGGLWAVGELGLEGTIRPVRGVLPIAVAAQREGARLLLVPTANLHEATLVEGLAVAGVGSLAEAAAWMRGETTLNIVSGKVPSGLRAGQPASDGLAADLAEVRGQPAARRALEVAAAGGHHLLLTGPTGAGKTLLARCLAGLLPPMTHAEALELTGIYSLAGRLPAADPLVRIRPSRAPHHTVSVAGLIGGGARVLQPGEVSLAHHGVLFLDELVEFPRVALEALRQPLTEGHVTVVRSTTTSRLPAAITLVGAAALCPCGRTGDPTRACGCGVDERRRYQRRLAGPLLSHIDVFAELAPLRSESLTGMRESSATVRGRVTAARARQAERGAVNAQLPADGLEERCHSDLSARQALTGATERLGLTVGAYQRTLRVARTIADLDGVDQVTADHITQALDLGRLTPDTGQTCS